ncbi:MAG: ORF6N domain-containing protein [Clostridia bacterium]|nr:ORF6N domain-containing protein [Clostridia bacterium]
MILQNELPNKEIKNLIYAIRGKQVMLDSDVAMLYHYETKNINKAVKRNIERFPEDFCFQLTKSEVKNLRFQTGTSSIEKENYGGRRYLPYAFTEQGIAMLAGILKSDIAVNVSINIIKSFIEMRRFLIFNGQVFERLTNIEAKLLEHDKKFNEIFNQLQLEENIKQKIFFQGQIYDAYSLIIDIIKRANQKILIIDNYIDDSILKMLTKKKKEVEIRIVTSSKSKIQNLDIQKFNKQYPILKINYTNQFHDRFIVIDEKELYHCGASIKDLGKKCFAINQIEDKKVIEKLMKV